MTEFLKGHTRIRRELVDRGQYGVEARILHDEEPMIGRTSRRAANPVKDTTCSRAWIQKIHSVQFQTLATIVDAMPHCCYPKKGIKQLSTAKIVGRVIVEVGIRPVDL